MEVPTWSEVAERYKGNMNAESFLINKISDGGSGSWGNMDMPPYYELSKTELKIIVQGILAYGPAKPAPENSVKQRKGLMQKK
jgi:cytochrome c